MERSLGPGSLAREVQVASPRLGSNLLLGALLTLQGATAYAQETQPRDSKAPHSETPLGSTEVQSSHPGAAPAEIGQVRSTLPNDWDHPWIELRLPEQLGLEQPERFRLDLQAGLASANLALVMASEPLTSMPGTTPAAPRALVIVTAKGPGILHVRVEAPGRSTPLERTVHLAELPSTSRELALAILIEELIRAALTPEPRPAASEPEPSREPNPPSSPKAPPLRNFSFGTELGVKAMVWDTAPLALAGMMRVSWNSGTVQLGLQGSYGRFLDRSTEAGVAHGEIWQLGLVGLVNLLHASRFRLGPFAQASMGEATFWSESYAGFAPGRVTGIVIDLGLGVRTTAEWGALLVSWEVGAAMPLAGVVATLDGAPLVDTTTLFGCSSFNLGVAF